MEERRAIQSLVDHGSKKSKKGLKNNGKYKTDFLTTFSTAIPTPATSKLEASTDQACSNRAILIRAGMSTTSKRKEENKRKAAMVILAKGKEE